MRIIEGDTRVCGVNTNMVRDMVGWRERIRLLDVE